jgi:hypothetical protein
MAAANEGRCFDRDEFLKPLGILGVALGTPIGGFLIRVIVQPWWVCKAAGPTYLSNVRFLGKMLVSTIGIMGAAVALTDWLIKPTYVSTTGTAVCATLIYAVGVWLIIFNRSDREMILTLLMRRSEMFSEPIVANIALEWSQATQRYPLASEDFVANQSGARPF